MLKLTECRLESQINKINDILRNNPGWLTSARKFLQEALIRDYFGAIDSTIFFAYHYNPKEIPDSPLISQYWNELYYSLHRIFFSLDKSGVSRYLIDISPMYLQNFSYADSKDFRLVEEDLLSSINIPKIAWDNYWKLVDTHKDYVFKKMSTIEQDYKLSRIIDISKLFQQGPGDVTPLSPFKFGKAVITGISTLTLVINGFIGLSSAGIAFASILAPTIALSYVAGRS